MQHITQVSLVLCICLWSVKECSAQRSDIRGSKAATKKALDAVEAVQDLQLQQNEINRVLADSQKAGTDLFGKGIGWGDRKYLGTFNAPGESHSVQKLAVDDWGYLPKVVTVMNVIDDVTMLVTVSDYPTNRFKQDASRVVIVKGFDTSKVTSDLVLTLTHPVIISRTQSYNTVGGGAKTVLVLERNDDVIKKLVASLPKQPDKKSAKKTAKVAEKSAKVRDKSQEIPDTEITGAAAYDRFPQTLRDRLVRDWEGELEALKRAIEDDKQRLSRAKTAKEQQHFERLIVEYTQKLERHKRNDPPYFTKEGREAVSAVK